MDFDISSSSKCDLPGLRDSKTFQPRL
jgi:hypothetical protein